MRESPSEKQAVVPKSMLVIYRARYYDPETGEFISRDPLEYVDGMSLYRGYFVPDEVDPLGLERPESVTSGTTRSVVPVIPGTKYGDPNFKGYVSTISCSIRWTCTNGPGGSWIRTVDIPQNLGIFEVAMLIQSEQAKCSRKAFEIRWNWDLCPDDNNDDDDCPKTNPNPVQIPNHGIIPTCDELKITCLLFKGPKCIKWLLQGCGKPPQEVPVTSPIPFPQRPTTPKIPLPKAG